LFLACAAPRLAIRPAGDQPQATSYKLRAPADTVQAWQLAHNGDFLHAEQRMAVRNSQSDALARGLLSIYRARPDSAEADFRRVLDSGADSAVRSVAYTGLECLFLSQERYAGLESLELRARREHLEYDTTNRFVAQALNRMGAMRIESASSILRRPMKLSLTGTPIIRLSANGRAVRDFWLDTGASMSAVTESFAREHGIRIVSEAGGSAGTSTGRKVPVRMGVIDSLRSGGLTLRNVPVIVLRDQDLSFKLLFITLLKIDAIIGWPVISRFRTTLDYPNRELTLEEGAKGSGGQGFKGNSGTPEPQNPGIPEPHNLFFAGQPCVQVAVDSSGPLNFILDTGATLCMITRAGLNKLLAVPALGRSLGCIGGAGGSDAGGIKSIKAARLTIAGQELYPVSLAVHDVPDEGLAIKPDGLLGEDVLRNFKVVIDARNGVLTLTR
jgi:predicted aspartyl protease